MNADTVSLIWKYEKGELRGQDVTDLFRILLSTGDIWLILDPHAPEHYLQQAAMLITRGALKREWM